MWYNTEWMVPTIAERVFLPADPCNKFNVLLLKITSKASLNSPSVWEFISSLAKTTNPSIKSSFDNPQSPRKYCLTISPHE